MSNDGPSKMDITEQRAMYDAFWTWTIRISAFCAAVVALLFLLVF